MSKVKIKGNASGTGVLTIEAPNTNTDRTITLPDGTGELIQADASGNVGIGTDDPQATLDVSSGTGSDTVPVLKLGSNATHGHTFYDSSSNGDLIIKRMVGGVENETMRFSRSSGKVGIGTTSPSSKLEVYGGGISDIPLVIDHAWGSSSTALLTASAGGTEVLKVQRDGRGLSQFTAKAWVNFNGIGTVAINDSHNVSSITDNGTGTWYLNYGNNMSNSNYAIVANGTDSEAERGRHVFTRSKSTSQGFISGGHPDQSARDINDISVIVFGD